MSWKVIAHRLINAHSAKPSRVGLAVGGLTALLVFGAVSTSGLAAATLGAVAALVGVSSVVYYAVDGHRHIRQEMRDLWGLSHVVSDGRPWPAPGGWALGADAISFLLRAIDRRSASTVVEFGPGASSVILARSRPDLRVVGVEHDPRFVEVLHEWQQVHDLPNLTILTAPLQADGWYERDVIERLPERIDVLVIDGPPNWKGNGSRMPGLSVAEQVGEGGIVLIDDTHRPDERRMAQSLSGSGFSVVWDAGTWIALVRNPTASSAG